MHIQIKEVGITETGEFQLEITFDETATFSVELINPHTKTIEENLEWYFEQYINEPYTASTRVQKERERIEQYGINLFKDLFALEEMQELYHAGIERDSYDNLTIEILSGEYSVALQAILWEALRDPKWADRPLVARGVKIYRNTGKETILTARANSSPQLNVLIVSARPWEDEDAGYRTIQRPLIESADNIGQRINSVILRPGTYETLNQHLQEAGSGFYHIIHFDLHGMVTDYKSLVREREAGNMQFQFNQFGKKIRSFQERYGRYDLTPFEGMKAFLVFETQEKGKSEPTSATEVAQLLREYRIPVCILNACQSAKQAGDSNETSLAKYLQDEGIKVVLAMRYSVLVETAKLLMSTIYEEIFNNRPLSEAIVKGKHEIFHQKNRSADFGYSIELEDWLLPIVYQREEVVFELTELTKEQKKEYNQYRKNLPTFPHFQFGFFGRDLDILKIEKMLLNQQHLLLRGMIGVGKSTLLQYLTAWWQRTGFRKIINAIYFDFRNDYNEEKFVDELANKILTDFSSDQLAKDGIEFWMEELLTELNKNPYALIIDNVFEFAYPNLIDFFPRIRNSSFVVYGSVNPEKALQPVTFRDNVYLLEGLDPNAMYELAGAIIKKTAQKDIQDLGQANEFELKHLLRLLAGFPRAMTVVLPFLSSKTVEEVLEEFQDGTLPIE